MKQVLVVDDDIWMAEYISKVLKRAGYLVTISSDGYSAIDIIDEKIPDAMFLDVLLPAANGFALLQELKSYSDTCEIPVVICSTLNFLDNFKDSLSQYGVKRFLDKSTMTADDILGSIRSVT